MTRDHSTRAKCLDYRASDKTGVRCCPCLDCPLLDYRIGRTPQGGYSAFLDKEFFKTHMSMQQVEFNRLLLASVHRLSEDGRLRTKRHSRN